jgi:hypothetical protein
MKTDQLKELLNRVRLNLTVEGTLKLVLWVTFMVVVVYFSNQCGKPNVPTEYEKAIATWQAKTDSLTKINTELRKENTAIKNEVARNEKKADSLTVVIGNVQTKARKDRAQRDSALKALTLANDTAACDCTPALTLAQGFKIEADSLNVALSLAAQRDSIRLRDMQLLYGAIGSLETQNDSLVAQLNRVPVHKPEKFLGIIPYPSRKTSAIIGLTVGVVGTVVAISAVQ